MTKGPDLYAEERGSACPTRVNASTDSVLATKLTRPKVAGKRCFALSRP